MTTTLAPGQFANEEVPSRYGYPQGYAVKPLTVQIATLVKLFPNLDPVPALAYTVNLPALPEGAEGWFAIPNWEKIAKTYNLAVETVLAIISSTRLFANNNYAGQFGPNCLLQSERSARMFTTLAQGQSGDILIVPAQFGKRHTGRSVRRAQEVFTEQEFGLGAFAAACLLLTHPERLTSSNDLWIDCIGDEHAPDVAGRDIGVPCFYFDDRLTFDAFWSGTASGDLGSASGFLPQSAA